MTGPSRRAVLGALAAAVACPAAGVEPLRRVLFVGNSFLRQHDVPGRVAALARVGGRPIDSHAILRNGATLEGHLRHPALRQTLGWGWEVVVLQDFSTNALFDDRRRRASEAVRLMQGMARGAEIVLVTPWPRAPGHRLYERAAAPGFAAPRTPVDMARANGEHAVALSADLGARVAPVASAWVEAMAGGADLHAADGYHANPQGAALTARVLWGSLSPLLP